MGVGRKTEVVVELASDCDTQGIRVILRSPGVVLDKGSRRIEVNVWGGDNDKFDMVGIPEAELREFAESILQAIGVMAGGEA